MANAPPQSLNERVFADLALIAIWICSFSLCLQSRRFTSEEGRWKTDAYDFGESGTVVDGGGGNGSVLSAILSRHPSLQGVLFDLPAAADRTRDGLHNSPVASRMRCEGGSFFEFIPPGADAYVLRHVIHDWEDKDAIRILHNCRKAMKPNSRIALVETVITSSDAPGLGKWLDLMLLLVRGREGRRRNIRC